MVGKTLINSTIFYSGVEVALASISSKLDQSVKIISDVIFNTLNITDTTDSINYNNGSVVINGGVGIKKNTNILGKLHIFNTNDTTGSGTGSTQIDGGMYINKSLIVNGGITGDITVPFITSWSIVTSGVVNITGSITMNKIRLLKIGNERILNINFSFTPSIENTNTQFRFDLPEKTNSITNRYDIFAQTSGFLDDLTVLSNVLTTGVTSSTQAIVTLQSSSTSTHNIQISLQYTD